MSTVFRNTLRHLLLDCLLRLYLLRSRPSWLRVLREIAWPLILGVGWLLGVFVFAVRWTINIVRLARLVRGAALVNDAGWRREVQRVGGKLGIRRSVTLLESENTEVPLTTGVLYPKVILP